MVQSRITANDFLWHMPRFIAGVLIAVGKGELTIKAVEKMLVDLKKGDPLYLAKPKALCLEKVSY